MASMMGGDFVEAYVLKNAYKEKVRRMEEPEAAKSSNNGGGAAGSGEKKKASGSGRGGGLFGLIGKKVHPKAASATETSGASS